MNPQESEMGRKVARKILQDTLRVKKGETVAVETWNNGLPFARQVVLEARKLGSIPLMIFEDESAYVSSVKDPGSAKGEMGRHEYAMLAETDAYIFIPGPVLGIYSRKLKPEEREESTRYNRSWYEAARKTRLRGARLSFGYAGPEMAKYLGKTINSIVEHQLKAALVDTEKIRSSADSVVSILNDGVPASVQSKGARLDFRLGRSFTLDDGLVDEKDLDEGNNMNYVPPGYLAVDVEEGTAEGKVELGNSLTKLGIVKDGELTFSKGRITEWKSRSGQRLLDTLLKPLDEQKRVLSSITVGLNPLLKRGYGVDRMSAGAVGLFGFGFGAFVARSSLLVNGKAVTSDGKLVV